MLEYCKLMETQLLNAKHFFHKILNMIILFDLDVWILNFGHWVVKELYIKCVTVQILWLDCISFWLSENICHISFQYFWFREDVSIILFHSYFFRRWRRQHFLYLPHGGWWCYCVYHCIWSSPWIYAEKKLLQVKD